MDIFKESFLVPIPKEVNTIDIAKYRGIAIQSILPKILDNIINNRLCLATEALKKKLKLKILTRSSTNRADNSELI